MADKVIVTNVSALRAKYGDNFRRVKAAIKALIEADAGRDLVTRLVAIDSVTDMARVGGKAVGGPEDQEGAKARRAPPTDRRHPFSDPEVDTLVGKRIRGEGFVSAGQFLMERYEVLRG